MWDWIKRYLSTGARRRSSAAARSPAGSQQQTAPAAPAVVDEEGNVVVPVSPDAKRTPSGNTTELASAKSRRHMRMAAFVMFAVISSAYFITLLLVLRHWLTHKDSLWMIARLQHQSAFLIGGAIVVFASIPLSLTLAMVRLAQDPQPKDEKEDTGAASISSITTPGLEAIKTIAEALKNVTGKG